MQFVSPKMARRVVLAELDEHVALVPTLCDELKRVAVTGLEILVRIEAQPERDSAAPAVGVVAQIFLALEEHGRAHLFREV